MKFILHLARALSLATLLIVNLPALAQSPSTPPAPMTEEERQAEARAAWASGVQAGTSGPADVALIDQATLQIADGQMFIPKAEAVRIMRALGNRPNEQTLQGLIIGRQSNWFVVARYIKEGYIKDDDAKNWNADELLDSLRQGTEQANADRRARGFPEMEVLGWVEKPIYDAVEHRLVWSLLSKSKGAPDDEDKGINYNTYALGRDGYFSLNLITNQNGIEQDKAVAKELLSNLSYRPGKGYNDFNASTDHIAAYGLAALVGGVVLKKIGLFAVFAAFAAKFAKVIVIGVIAFGAAIRKMFGWGGRNKNQS